MKQVEQFKNWSRKIPEDRDYEDVRVFVSKPSETGITHRSPLDGHPRSQIIPAAVSRISISGKADQDISIKNKDISYQNNKT